MQIFSGAMATAIHRVGTLVEWTKPGWAIQLLADFQTRMEGGASRLRKDLGARNRRDGRGFEVRSSRFSERRTPNFELWITPFSQVSRFARHGLWRWQTFSASC